MRGKTVAGLHKVFVDYAKGAKAGVLWVVVITEGEAVISIEPAEIEMASLFSFANCDHKNSRMLRRLQVVYSSSFSFADWPQRQPEG